MNWENFFTDLDIAVADMIVETGKLPSETSVLEFTQFVNKKRGL